MGIARWTYATVRVCDPVVPNDWQALDRRTDERVAELSWPLRRMSPDVIAGGPKSRNADVLVYSGTASDSN